MQRHRHGEALQWLTGWVLFPICAALALPMLVPVAYVLRWLLPDGVVSIVVLLLWLPVAGVFTRLLTVRIYFWRNRRRIHERDLVADTITRRVMAGEPTESFVLYLRSFQADASTYSWYSGKSDGVDFHATSFDDELAFALEANAINVVCVGSKAGSRVGAGRFAANDAEWEEIVHALMRSAGLIVVCPSDTPSIIREMEYIAGRSDLASKSIFVMLPTLASHVWNKLRARFLPRGIGLPAHQQYGACFNLFGATNEFPYKFSDRNELMQCLQQVHPTFQHQSNAA